MSVPTRTLKLVVLVAVMLGLSHLCFSFQASDKSSNTDIASPAPPPLAPEQMPPGPVVITYQNGALTIQTFNSELKDVLRAVSRETGALIDIPPNANERVFGEFGPGPTAKVLASLLNGTHFNYVFVARPDNPQYLAQVTLTPRPVDVVPSMKSVQAKHKDPNAVAAQLDSGPPQPAQPGRTPLSLPTTPPQSGKPLGDQSFQDALTSELGPEASSIDPQQRRALESMLAQMSAQASSVDAVQRTKMLPRKHRQRIPTQPAPVNTSDIEIGTE